MCDYSLMAFPSRLAVSGDELVVHRFDAKSMGLAAAFEVRRAAELNNAGNKGFRARLQNFFRPANTPIRTVCIPPGARVLIRDIPAQLQHAALWRRPGRRFLLRFLPSKTLFGTQSDFKTALWFCCSGCTRVRACVFWISLRMSSKWRRQGDANA